MAGLAAIDNLIDAPSADEEKKAIKFANTLSNGLRYAHGDYEFLAAVSSCGHAIANGPVALMQDYIDDGSLLPILKPYWRPSVGMYAVYPPGRLVAGRVRMFSDSLAEYFRGRDI